MKGHLYKWENVIIGYNLSAFIYAFYTGHPVIGFGTSAPKIFDEIDKVDYGSYGFGKGETELQIELWHRLYMILSMGGQLPFADNVSSIRLDENRTLTVTTKNRSRVTKVSHDCLWFFDDHGVVGLPSVHIPCVQYRITDWFNVRSGMRHAHQRILTPDDNLVREIYFYPSERIDGHHPDKKDLCAISYLDEEQIDQFEYSSTYAKFKILDTMKSYGIRGASNGTCPKYGTSKHYALKIEFDKREKERVGMHIYHTIDESLIFNRLSAEEMLSEIRYNNQGPRIPANPYIPKVLLKS